MAKRAERTFGMIGRRRLKFHRARLLGQLKKGLLAATGCNFALRRMEVAYLDQNRREYEITKHILACDARSHSR